MEPRSPAPFAVASPRSLAESVLSPEQGAGRAVDDGDQRPSNQLPQAPSHEQRRGHRAPNAGAGQIAPVVGAALRWKLEVAVTRSAFRARSLEMDRPSASGPSVDVPALRPDQADRRPRHEEAHDCDQQCHLRRTRISQGRGSSLQIRRVLTRLAAFAMAKPNPVQEPKLSAIIVAYRTPAEVAAAVASLRGQTLPPDDIVIVDNGAPDGDPLPELAGLEGARIERPQSNLGYGAGCNLGAQATSGDDLLILNADVVLTAGAIAALATRLRSDDRIAVVGPRIFSHGEVQLSARAFPSLRTGLLGRRSLLTRLLLRARRYPAEFRRVPGSGGPVDWVSGACMLVRRAAFDSVEGFDEGYWMYWEDADLCRRLVDEGWEVHFEPASVVDHATGASGTSARTIRAFHESAARFAARHIARTALERSLIRAVLETRTWFVLWMFARAGANTTDEGARSKATAIDRSNQPL